MYGLVMLFALLTESDKSTEEASTKRLDTMLRACVPEEKWAEVKDELETENKELGSRLGWQLFARGLGATLTLALGWIVHTFLA